MRALYDFSLLVYQSLIRIAGLWMPKAKAWLDGRKGLLDSLEDQLAGPDTHSVWMHCASLGEFEQGRPVLEAIRKAYPGHKIVLTFFSPSGYEIRKHFPGADIVTYLPLDSRSNAERFIAIMRPRLAIFVKYEHWYHYLKVLEEKGVTSLLISAIFRKGQPFFAPYGGFWRKMLGTYKAIFVQDEDSLRLLAGIGLSKYSHMAGDTRFDRVLTVAEDSEKIPALEQLTTGKKVVVAGSTWPADEQLLAAYAENHKDTILIIAPHEIHEAHLASLEDLFSMSIRFSKLRVMPEASRPDTISQTDHQVVIIDNIGLLSKLYRYAGVAYIGGGFNKSGIHNILEAAVYGVPVVFGPTHHKSREALDLLGSGGAFTISDATGLSNVLDRLFSEPKVLHAKGLANKEYVHRESGATGRILSFIQENRLLTS
jgi:3-deoxy-D-manno-octulosonic-acid transferase